MRKLLIFFMVIIGFALTMESCQYKFAIEPIIPPPDPTDTIYFSQQVEPIWNNGSLCVSCHSGSLDPDLTTNNSYASLMDGGFVDTENPTESKIYAYVYPGASTHERQQYTESQAAIILQWIEQGALNN